MPRPSYPRPKRNRLIREKKRYAKQCDEITDLPALHRNLAYDWKGRLIDVTNRGSIEFPNPSIPGETPD